MEKETFQFKKAYTGGVLYESLGRLQLARGSIVRLVFTPDGFVLAIPESAKTSGEIMFFDEAQFGVGAMPQEP